jgi:hypothetical protein
MNSSEHAIFFWSGYYALFSLFFWIYNKRLKTSDKLSDEQAQELINEEFPKKFSFYYNSIVIICVVIGPIIGGIIYFWLSGLISTGIENMIYFNYSMFSMLLFVLFFLFLGLFLGLGVIISSMALASPKFGRFVLKRQILEATRLGGSNLRRPSYKIGYKLYLTLLVVLFFIGAPLLFLAVDNYSYVNKSGLVNNSFFSLNKKTLSWDDVVKVEIKHSIHDGRLEFFYFVSFRDGPTINIWKNGYLKELSQINDVLKSKDIIFDIKPIDEETGLFIEDEYSSDSIKLELIKRIFSN